MKVLIFLPFFIFHFGFGQEPININLLYNDGSVVIRDSFKHWYYDEKIKSVEIKNFDISYNQNREIISKTTSNFPFSDDAVYEFYRNGKLKTEILLSHHGALIDSTISYTYNDNESLSSIKLKNNKNNAELMLQFEYDSTNILRKINEIEKSNKLIGTHNFQYNDVGALFKIEGVSGDNEKKYTRRFFYNDMDKLVKEEYMTADSSFIQVTISGLEVDGFELHSTYYIVNADTLAYVEFRIRKQGKKMEIVTNEGLSLYDLLIYNSTIEDSISQIVLINENSVIIGEINYEYDEAGNQTKIIEMTYNDQGVLTSKNEKFLDENGNILKEVEDLFDGGKESKIIREYFYKDTAQIIKKIDTRYDNKGRLLYTYIEEYKYHQNGNRMNYTHTKNDKKGKIISVLKEINYDESGNIAEEIKYEYNSYGGRAYETTYKYEYYNE